MSIDENFYLSLFFTGGEVAKITLGLQTYLIGRNQNLKTYIEENFVCLNFGFISRFHCSLVMFTDEEEGTSYYKIWDGIPLKKPSRLGTYVNGKKIHSARLYSGDVINFADPKIGGSVPHLVFTETKIDLSNEEETAAHEI
jgi:pSer/pThr/pTyr-binding forkhead associated (FHA) protein